MSIDRTLLMGIGWHLDNDQTDTFFESFKKVTQPKVSHMEDRFDTRTGVKLTPVEIVDQHEEIGWVVNDRVFDTPWPEFLEELNSQFEHFHFELANNTLLIFVNAEPMVKKKTQIDVREDDLLSFQLPQNLFTLLEIARQELRGWMPDIALGCPEIIGAIDCH